ncbi:MAG: hypothetical protein AAB426_07205 [Myxococcota bacterium]|mgnify:CR=1 FL=1
MLWPRTLLLSFGLLVPFGCAALRPPPATPVQADTEEDEDEDSGVDGLLDTMRSFTAELTAQHFDRAGTLLRRAQRGVRNASELTRSHPEFEDVEAAVERANVRLSDAIERDREMRRQQAIADLRRRAEQVLSRGASLYEELRQRPATADDVQLLTQMRTELEALRNDGIPYADDPGYRAHATDRDKKAQVLAQLEQRSSWGVTASTRLREVVGKGLSAEQRGAKSSDPSEQAQAYRQAVDAFVACTNMLSDLEREPVYDAAVLVDLPSGATPLGVLKPLCLKRGADARARADKLTWQVEVERRLATLRAAVGAQQAATTADAVLASSTRAVEALNACETELAALVRHPGADATAKLETPYGPVGLARLVQQCRTEQTKLRKQLPSLAWRTTLQSLFDPLSAASAGMQQAAAGPSGAARLSLWQQALGKIYACISEAKRLASEPAADATYRMQTPAGELTVAQVEAFCIKQKGLAEEQEKKARAEATTETFVESCRGDERTIVRKEGVPTRIEQVQGGRVFYYDAEKNKASALRRYGFDTTGAQVDFWRRWENQVGALLTELSGTMARLRTATSGTDRLGAIEAATPVLQVCQELLSGSRTSPGYDPTHAFDSPFGSRRAPELAKACATEAQKLARGLDTLRWQAKVEALVARLDSGVAQLLAAKDQRGAKAKLEVIGQAQGSFKECVERLPALQKEPGAQPKQKVKSSQGQLDLAGLARACASQEKAANSAIEAALALQTLEQFVATCRGDETAVAEREGMPTRIEEAGGGRVFVYVGKKRGRKPAPTNRFAFDAQGRRTSEKQLRAVPGVPSSSPSP